MSNSQETPPQPNNELISRRKFTQLAGHLGLYSLVAIPAAAIGFTDRNLKYPSKDLREVPIGEGRKVKLILGSHEGPGETKIDPEDYVRPIAGIFWDSRDKWLEPEFIQSVDRYVETPSTSPFYSEAIRLVKDESVPIIFGDSPLSDRDIDIAIQENDNRHLIAILSSALAGLGLSIDALNNKMTRRDFLKWTARLAVFGGSVSSTYFSSDSLAEAAKRLGVTSNSDTERELMAIFSDLIHPDNYIIVMRNIIWTLKNRDLYDQKIFSDGQIVNVLGGGNHRFIEFFLKHPDIAEKYFQIFQYKDVIKRIWDGDEKNRDWVHTTLIYRYKGGSEYVEHQALRKLLD